MNQIKDFLIRFAAFARQHLQVLLPYLALTLLPLVLAMSGLALAYTPDDGAPFFVALGVALLVLLVSYVLQISIQKRYYSFCHPGPVDYATTLHVILQTLRIALLQTLILVAILVLPLLVVSVILSATTQDNGLITKVMFTVGALGGAAWMFRLVFVPYILILKRNSYRMKDIVSESCQIILGNKTAFNLYLLMILVVYVPTLLFAFYPVHPVAVTIVQVIQALFSMLYVFLNMQLFSMACPPKPARPAEAA